MNAPKSIAKPTPPSKVGRSKNKPFICVLPSGKTVEIWAESLAGVGSVSMNKYKAYPVEVTPKPFEKKPYLTHRPFAGLSSAIRSTEKK